MPKIYLLGGEVVYQRSARAVNEAAFEDAKPPRNVLVFPWARASFDLQYRRRQILTDYLRALGADNVEFMEYGQPNSLAEKIAESNIIYLTGGQPSILLERIRAMALQRLLASFGGVIVGRSAGALALCSRCIATVRSSRKAKILAGLGLVDITLKTHYTPARDDEVLGRLSREQQIFAVPEGSAIISCNGSLSTIGAVYLFCGGQRQALQADL